jgi:predicted alpha/beta hydrolase
MQPRTGRSAQAALGRARVVVERGAKVPGRASIAFLPALGVPVAYYEPLLEEWARRDRHVITAETRGMPLASPRHLRRTPFGYQQLIRHDLPELVQAFDDTLHVVVGHSLGGQLALLGAASRIIDPAAVITIATGTSSVARTSTLRARAVRHAQIATVRSVSALLGYWPGDVLGFAGRQPRTLMRDWSFEARHGRYRLHGQHTDYEVALQGLPQPALLVAIEGDPLISPASVDHLAARLPGNHRTRVVRAGATDHLLWARRRPDLVVDAVEEWLGGLDL